MKLVLKSSCYMANYLNVPGKLINCTIKNVFSYLVKCFFYLKKVFLVLGKILLFVPVILLFYYLFLLVPGKMFFSYLANFFSVPDEIFICSWQKSPSVKNVFHLQILSNLVFQPFLLPKSVNAVTNLPELVKFFDSAVKLDKFQFFSIFTIFLFWIRAGTAYTRDGIEKAHDQ